MPTDGADSLRWCARQAMTSRRALAGRGERSAHAHTRNMRTSVHLPGSLRPHVRCVWRRVRGRKGGGKGGGGHSQRIGAHRARCKQAEHGSASTGEGCKAAQPGTRKQE